MEAYLFARKDCKYLFFARAIGREGFLFVSTFEHVRFNIEIHSLGIFIRLWKNGEPDIGKSEPGVQISSRKIRKERALYLHENHLTSNILEV